MKKFHCLEGETLLRGSLTKETRGRTEKREIIGLK